ncbi:uncharacterized protein LOC112562286 [Pomacea canaliculata]|uniref:uncharacterized protein LOC112562286 n=1 Tax=Pomacea canaliculata TaxID=400727 RepID=UPI000D737069|nr:uncharacterized protein LOC112562286 [Pomacea canaliculata]
MATSLLAIVLPCSILFFYGWQENTVVALPVVEDDCQDHVGLGMTCEEMPNFCNNTYAHRVCPRKCGFCVPGSTVESVVISTHSTTDGDCFDKIVNRLTCDDLYNFCGDPYSVSLCPSTCNICTRIEPPSSPETFQSPTTVSAPSTTSSTAFISPSPHECKDDVQDPAVCNYPHICSNAYVQKVCRKSCGLCCADHLRNLSCQDFLSKYSKNPCEDELGQAACPKFCQECV